MNLLSKLHKNSILTGPIESFCLACSCILRGEEESYEHIHNPDHVDKLLALPILDEFKDDFIIKIKEGYFCPHCNFILPTIKKVSLHVIEPKHRENKISQSITRQAGSIHFGSVLVDPRSWHGVDGATCSVCDEDYSDEEQHTQESGHVLKLIQAKCEIGDNYLYRNVDDLFFCLICKIILPIPEKETHHESKTHIEFYEQSKKKDTLIVNENPTELNYNIAPVDQNEIVLTTVNKKEDTKPGIKPIEDCKEAVNNNITTQVNKEDNGNSHIVVNNRATTKKDSHRSLPLEAVLKNTLPNSISTNVSEAKIPEPAYFTQPKTNSIANEYLENTESYVYEFLELSNFVIKPKTAEAFCILCAIPVPESANHGLDKHHNLLYAKHIARKNKLSQSNVKNTTVETKEFTSNSIATGKENVTKQATDKIIAKKNDIPEIPFKNVLSNTNNNNVIEQKNQLVNQATPEQQSTVEINKKENERLLHFQPKTKVVNMPKKAIKKAKKKAIKFQVQHEESSTSAVLPEDRKTETENCRDQDTNTSIIKNLKEEVIKDDNSITTNHDVINKVTASRGEEIAGSREFERESLVSFIKTISQVESSPKDVIVNGRYVIGNLSFALVLPRRDSAHCAACNEALTVNISEHITTDEHMINVEACSVVSSLDGEFIRQLKTEEFHCGYCHLTIPDWAETKAHLESYRHDDARTSAFWRMKRYQPQLKRSPKTEVRSVLTTIFRCTTE